MQNDVEVLQAGEVRLRGLDARDRDRGHIDGQANDRDGGVAEVLQRAEDVTPG